MPDSDEDYDPHTVYGESKVRMERLIRHSEIPCPWSIIRPTNVWGPWHMRYRRQFFKVLKMGLYFHPGGKDCVKSYAFVGNVVDQICRIIDAPASDVNGKTFNVGDAPVPLLDWVNAFAIALSGRKARVIPSDVVYGLAKIGDAISAVTGRRFLITTSRYNSMTEDYPTPMDKTFDVLGMPRYSLNEGVRLTVEWLDNYDSELGRRSSPTAKQSVR
jgi:nucleoside-diphosphate-sugar epimerase